MLPGVWGISPGSLHSTGFPWDRVVLGNLSSLILFPPSSILGVGAIEPSEEGEPGIRVFSSSAWAKRGPPQVRARPEEDRDHLHHPQDDAREADARVPSWMLSLKVQNGPEEDRDHLYHPQVDTREADTYRPPRMLSLKVQNGPEEDRDHIYHS